MIAHSVFFRALTKVIVSLTRRGYNVPVAGVTSFFFHAPPEDETRGESKAMKALGE